MNVSAMFLEIVPRGTCMKPQGEILSVAGILCAGVLPRQEVVGRDNVIPEREDGRYGKAKL